VAECQSGGVEGLSRRGLFQQLRRPALGSGDPAAAAATVDRISDYWVAHVAKMDPNLVSPSGVELQPEKIDHVKPRHHRGIGSGGSTGRGHDHPLPVLLLSANRGIDLDWALIQMTPHQSGITPAHPAGGNGGAEPAVGNVGLGHDHEARRIPVQPVDDARTPFCASG
jgi:hypothetical protein